MSRFVHDERGIVWQETPQWQIIVTEWNMEDQNELLTAPGFLEFIAANNKEITALCFEVDHVYAYNQHNSIYLVYYSTIVGVTIRVRLAINLAGRQRVSFYDNCQNMSLEEFKQLYPRYIATCQKLQELKTENVRMKEDLVHSRAEIERLRAENLELSVRPGGPEYERARERFHAQDYTQ